MKAISKQDYLNIISNLQKLQEQCKEDILYTDGILESMQSLRERYTRYEELISKLSDCISEYNQLHKHVKKNILSPISRYAYKKKIKELAQKENLGLQI